jgi:hypothetical protein
MVDVPPIYCCRDRKCDIHVMVVKASFEMSTPVVPPSCVRGDPLAEVVRGVVVAVHGGEDFVQEARGLVEVRD